MEEITSKSPTSSLSQNPDNGEKTNSTSDADPSQSTQTQKTTPSVHHKKNFPWIIFFIILFLGFLALAAWYFQTRLQTQKSATNAVPTPVTSTTLQNNIIIGTDPTLPPMEFIQNGNFVGYDIDLANLLAKQMNVQIKFKNVVFDNIFTALQQNRIDMIISAVTITPERQQKYDFSEEYLNAGQVIITQKNNNTIKSPSDLKGKKIGVQQGTTNEAQALKYTSTNLVIRYSTFVEATNALVAGQVDAIFDDLPSSQGIVSANPTLKIASDPFTNEYYGIVFRKGDQRVKLVNQALDSLRVRGYLTELKHKWLY